MLEAARLLPAHRRLPHVAFLNGLWWKLLAVQPERILACLPHLQGSSSTSAAGLYCPTEFRLEGFSAGSCTAAVVFWHSEAVSSVSNLRQTRCSGNAKRGVCGTPNSCHPGPVSGPSHPCRRGHVM